MLPQETRAETTIKYQVPFLEEVLDQELDLKLCNSKTFDFMFYT